MNREQAKTKLTEISRSTAVKHPKVLISELCGVVQFLLSEIERIKSPEITTLTTLPTIKEKGRIDPVPMKKPNKTSPLPSPQYPEPNLPPTETNLPYEGPLDPPFFPKPFRSPPIRDDQFDPKCTSKDGDENNDV